ncbi:XIAP-associated factor 1 isoform X1 [Synchiropus splendidus]|uniref:XIAP-associated factor 1 isoform X1 n=1 Tax=Synchiropus splendidus TaxID=270530 RepID=UPI00237E0FB2|nr:XIAP-associated factor 1 isoform X1 [Synchiropus splendidus]
MDVSEPTRTCDLCKKDVAEVNFSLHEAHCRRFLCLCPDCEEPVPKEQLALHREEEHAMVKCSKCNKKMEKRLLDDHEVEECVERMQECEFCQMELPFKDLHEHTVACGSRTELCIDCGRYVKLKDQQTHDQTCSGSSDTSAPPKTETVMVNCSQCSQAIAADDLDQHELECLPDSQIKQEEHSRSSAAPQVGVNEISHRLSDRGANLPHCNGEDPTALRCCPHCHLLLPLFTLQWHEVKCRRHVWNINKF